MKEILKVQTQQVFLDITARQPIEKIKAITDEHLRELAKILWKMDFDLKTHEIMGIQPTIEEYFNWCKEALTKLLTTI